MQTIEKVSSEKTIEYKVKDVKVIVGRNGELFRIDKGTGEIFDKTSEKGVVVRRIFGDTRRLLSGRTYLLNGVVVFKGEWAYLLVRFSCDVQSEYKDLTASEVKRIISNFKDVESFKKQLEIFIEACKCGSMLPSEQQDSYRAMISEVKKLPLRESEKKELLSVLRKAEKELRK